MALNAIIVLVGLVFFEVWFRVYSAGLFRVGLGFIWGLFRVNFLLVKGYSGLFRVGLGFI